MNKPRHSIMLMFSVGLVTFFLMSDSRVSSQSQQNKVDSLLTVIDSLTVVIDSLNWAVDSLQGVNDKLIYGWSPVNHTLFPADTVEFCGSWYSMADESIRERIQAELTFFLDRPHLLTLWYLRTGRYFPYIESELKAAGLSADLKYVAMLESGLDPTAVSAAKAVGLWQFIYTTGKRYALYKNKSFDSRRDPILATQAAIKHIGSNLATFGGDYLLALAAHNMGEIGLARRIKQQRTTNYFILHLPLETERYVPAAIALKIIFTTLDKYLPGLSLVPQFSPWQSTAIRIKVTAPTTWQALAELVQIPLDEFRKYNPGLLANPVAGGVYNIRVPLVR